MSLASLRDGLQLAICPSINGGGGIVPDLSGRNDHAILTNMSANSYRSHPKGLALSFDGNDDFLTITRNRRFDSTAIGTVSCWINATSFDGQFGFNDIIGCDVIGGTREWNFASYTSNGNSNDAGVGFTIFRDGSNTLSIQTATEILSISTWYHIAWTHDGSLTYAGMRLFVNGIEQSASNVSSGTLNTPSVSTTTPLQIGRRFGTSGFDLHWNGLIDDSRLYSRPLTPSEIQLLAIEPGIGLRPERTSVFFGSQSFQAAWLAQSRSIIGGGVC